jgi:hypothetical protein
VCLSGRQALAGQQAIQIQYNNVSPTFNSEPIKSKSIIITGIQVAGSPSAAKV